VSGSYLRLDPVTSTRTLLAILVATKQGATDARTVTHGPCEKPSNAIHAASLSTISASSVADIFRGDSSISIKNAVLAGAENFDQTSLASGTS